MQINKMSTPLKFSGKVWLEDENGKVLGPGRIELLELVQQHGSLRQAALQMKMSYKQAWDLIKQMNERLGAPVLTTSRGGKGGGSATVTEIGLKSIKNYKIFQRNFREFLEQQSPLIF
jgi:molybdate transport system regulatory protein